MASFKVGNSRVAGTIRDGGADALDAFAHIRMRGRARGDVASVDKQTFAVTDSPGIAIPAAVSSFNLSNTAASIAKTAARRRSHSSDNSRCRRQSRNALAA